LGQRRAREGEKYALLVGVREYDPNELRSLPYSEDDVTELAEVLRASGYKPGNVVLMTQTVGARRPRFLPLAGQVRKELRLLLQDLAENDGVLVALAGHGVQFVGDPESYFCPADARLADKSTLIPLGEVYKELEACGAGMKVLLVDACRNDPRSDNSRARAVVSLQSVTRPTLAKPPGGVVAFFSCSPGEKAYEHAELKHGVFFHYVIEGLRGAAVGAEEREILVPDLEKFVKRRVRDFVREKYGVRQSPELEGKTRDLVPLVSLAPPPAEPAEPLVPATIKPGREKPLRSGSNPMRETVKAQRPQVHSLLSYGKTITNSIGMKLTWIPAGTFLMGSTDDDRDALGWEKPQHRVQITQPFYLGIYEVTQGQYEMVMGQNPSFFCSKGAGRDRFGDQPTLNFPVEQVSWLDAVEFCNTLSQREGRKPFYQVRGETVDVPDRGRPSYRLPTEAEWEYACRGKSQTRYSFGDETTGLRACAWFGAGAVGPPHWVGQKRANGFGLFDMHGNIAEWCSDVYDANFYNRSSETDPTGPSDAGAAPRVVRGGCWLEGPRYLRSANRDWRAPNERGIKFGFRVIRGDSGR
jgi:formylglycine-generating enzyme required for sulfatase activity